MAYFHFIPPQLPSIKGTFNPIRISVFLLEIQHFHPLWNFELLHFEFLVRNLFSLNLLGLDLKFLDLR